MEQGVTAGAPKPKLECCYLNCTSDPQWLILSAEPDATPYVEIHSCNYHLPALLHPEDRNIVEKLA